MTTLQERLHELMQAMSWTRADIQRVSGQSSSVVSQWLGKGSKEIKAIGKLEAAIALAKASGYSPLWIAKGQLPKFAMKPATVENSTATKPEAWQPSNAELLESLASVLGSLPADRRNAVADNLAGFAREGGSPIYKMILLNLLDVPNSKHAQQA